MNHVAQLILQRYNFSWLEIQNLLLNCIRYVRHYGLQVGLPSSTGFGVKPQPSHGGIRVLGRFLMISVVARFDDFVVAI